MHNIPPESIFEMGLKLITKKLGALMSDMSIGSSSGRQYSWVNVSYPIDQPLKDHLSVTHPILGDLKIHIYYERKNWVCGYYAHIGHEISDYKKYAQVMRLMADSIYKDRPELMLLKERRRVV